MHAEFESENLKGRDDLGYLYVGVRIILKLIFEKYTV
jgi:hypothetical protein